MTTQTRMILALLICLGLGFPGAMNAQGPPSQPDSATALTNSYGLEFVGQVGGTTNAVAVQGNYAYVGIGHRMVVLDVTDPAHPTEVARTELLPGIVECLAISGYYAYVVAGGLHVLNIMNPAHPITAGTLPVEGVDIYVAGNYAYLAAGEMGLRIVDIRTPSAPTEVAFHITPGSAVAVHVSGDHAYVAAGSAGVRVLDVSDPTRPTEVSSFLPAVDLYSPGANDVFVSGERAYVATNYGYHNVLAVTDVSDPANPTQLGSYRIPAQRMTAGPACRVFVSGSHAFVSTEEFTRYDGPFFGLYRVDVSSPAEGQEISGPMFVATAEIQDLFVRDGHAYLAMGDVGLRILDAASLDSVGGGVPPGTTTGLHGCGPQTYLMEERSLRVVDSSDPAQPTGLGVCDIGHYPRDAIEAFYVSHPYAYLGILQNNPVDEWYVLWVMDLADPSAPTQVGSEGDWWWDRPIRAIHVSAGTACLAGGEWAGAPWSGRHYATFWMCDVSDPASPSEVGSLRFYSSDHDASIAEDVHVVGHTAYVLAQVDETANAHLWQVDITDPLHPTPVVSTTLPGTANHLVVHKGHAYVTGIADPLGQREPTLWVLDVSSPLMPLVVGSCSLANAATGIDVSLGHAYVTLGDAGLAVIDISSPASPTVVASYDTPGSAQGVQACGRSAYVADGSDGLIILRYTAPIPLYLPLALRGV